MTSRFNRQQAKIAEARAHAIEILGHERSPNHIQTLNRDDASTTRDARHLAMTLIMERDGPDCYLCGRTLTPETAAIEHIIPIAFGGHNHASNVAASCYDCNSDKAGFAVSFLTHNRRPMYHRIT